MSRLIAILAFAVVLTALTATVANARPSYAANYGYGPTTIHDVVSATWPPSLVPTAEQIMYHEGGGITNDGYCGWGIISSTQFIFNVNPNGGPYYCSRKAYEIYVAAGHSFWPWTTSYWYQPGAQYTPITWY